MRVALLWPFALARTPAVHALAYHGGRGPSAYRGGNGYRGVRDSGSRWAQQRSPRNNRPDSGDAELTHEDWDGTDCIYGVSPVLSALRSQRRTLHELYIQDTLTTEKRSAPTSLQEIDGLVADLGVEVKRRDKGTLNGLCGNRPHQGLVLRASPLAFAPLQALPEPSAAARGPQPLWLALDEGTDPQNMGALLRSAFFLGVDGVLVSAKNSCRLTPTVSKASAGAMELMTVHAARNLPRTLDVAREAGWAVVGAALERSVEPAELGASKPTVLVLGSEGHGLRTNVLRACTDLVRIPRACSGTAVQGDDAELVDSLNVTAVEIERASSTHHVLDLAPLLSPHLWCCACAGERRWRHLVVCNA